MPRIIDEELGLSLADSDAILAPVSADMANPPWEEARGRILILRLSPLADIEGSTSHLVLFSECRRALPGAYLDFGFLPPRKDREILASRDVGFFYGLESGRPASDFGLVLVSNSFALELLNLPYLYSGTGIASRASARAAAEASPIVILGGSNASCTGSLLLPGPEREEARDALVDGIFFGEGEGAIGEIALALSDEARPRAERLAAASGIGGLWLALSGSGTSRRRALPHPGPLVSYPILNFPGAASTKVQISAGCPGYCSFCLEGWEFRPYREIPSEEVLRTARSLKASSGARDLEIYSYNFNAHSDIYRLAFELNRIFRRVSFMSQRLDILAEAPGMAGFEAAADKRSFTLGIEGISERMRAFYRKGVDAAQVEAAAAAIAATGARELKLFYIVAGTETEEDIREFAEGLKRIDELRKGSAPGMRVLASAGYLVRLPFTPLQYAPLCLDRGILEGIAKRLEAAAGEAGIEFRLAADYEEYFADQLLALGGSALAAWLEECPASGFVYDGGLSKGAAASLESAARKAGLLEPGFLAEKGELWKPPLAFAGSGFEALRDLYLQAAAYQPKKGRIPSPGAPAEGERARLEKLMGAKRRFASILVRITFPRELAAACPEYRASWILRRIFASSPDSVQAVFDAEDALFGKGCRLEGFAEGYWGEAVFRIVGAEEKRLAAAARAAGFTPLGELPSAARIEAELELPSEFGEEAVAALKAYLAEERVSFVERKAKPGEIEAGRILEIAPKDARKGVRAAAWTASEAGGAFAMRLGLGPGGRVQAIVDRLGPRGARAARIKIVELS